MIRSAPLSKKKLHQMIRVNHAGEYGACALYRGQKSVLGAHPHYGPILDHMAAQEKVHQALFEDHMRSRHVRPSALLPLWGFLGYGLGAMSARISPKAAMACTVAVEEVIDQHYRDQIHILEDQVELHLLETVRTCHADELHHRDTGLDQGATSMRGYKPFYSVVQCATRLAISIAQRF